MALHVTHRKTRFAESDAAGIIHFSTFAVYVEEAEHEFLESAGFPVQLDRPDALHWPRVQFEARFLQPLRPFSAICIELTPQDVGRTSITWAWTVRKEDSGEEVASGQMKTVCCRVSDGQLAPTPLPDEFREKLTAGMVSR